MTLTEIMVLPAGSEMDALVDHLVFGREWEKHARVCINGHWYDEETWLLKGSDPTDPPKGTYAGLRPPMWASRLYDDEEVEDRLERLGLLPKYVGWLQRVVLKSFPQVLTDFHIGKLLLATPEERCRAALLTVTEGKR